MKLAYFVQMSHFLMCLIQSCLGRISMCYKRETDCRMKIIVLYKADRNAKTAMGKSKMIACAGTRLSNVEAGNLGDTGLLCIIARYCRNFGSVNFGDWLGCRKLCIFEILVQLCILVVGDWAGAEELCNRCVFALCDER